MLIFFERYFSVLTIPIPYREQFVIRCTPPQRKLTTDHQYPFIIELLVLQIIFIVLLNSFHSYLYFLIGRQIDYFIVLVFVRVIEIEQMVDLHFLAVLFLRYPQLDTELLILENIEHLLRYQNTTFLRQFSDLFTNLDRFAKN